MHKATMASEDQDVAGAHGKQDVDLVARWNEAQAAYFEAYRLDPEAADVAYNLAVSLDHLGQNRLAADFYQRALTASGQQSVQFDKGQVSRRLAELKP